jgi:hypothetical protein
MARFNRRVDKNVIAKRQKEGRGKGSKKNYKPWNRVQEMVTRGRVSRILGGTTGRQHEIKNKLHLALFLILDFSHPVDIREEFPLPLKATMKIAERLGIKHLTNRGGELIPYVSPFVVTRSDENNKECFDVFAVLYEKHLKKSHVIEYLEIQRVFWSSKRGRLWIVTENELPTQLMRNLAELQPWLQHKEFPHLPRTRFDEVVLYMDKVVAEENVALVEITKRCDRHFGLESGTSLAAAQYLIAKRYWKVNLQVPFLPEETLTLTGYPLITGQQV